MVERNTFDWGTLEGSSSVIIGKVLADERLSEVADKIGHVLPVNPELPVREMEQA